VSAVHGGTLKRKPLGFMRSVSWFLSPFVPSGITWYIHIRALLLIGRGMTGLTPRRWGGVRGKSRLRSRPTLGVGGPSRRL